MSKKSSILIDLTKVRDAQAYTDSNEIIQQDAMIEFFNQIDASLGNIKGFVDTLERDDNFERIRFHDTITVLGSRGSGKTTFILNMFKQLHSNKSSAEIKLCDGFSCSDIEILGILDPTLIEEKEHVFLNVLARIKNKVDEKRNGEIERRKESCHNNGAYQDWLNCLKTLAAALPLLDGVGSDDFLKSELWHDPVHVLEKGLQVASASNGLEVRFHQFVNKSLQLLGKKSFILAIDDIDTKFPSGWPVLEVIRKYLTTPQLIVVLSGDMSLYSKLVRKQQWQNFGNPLLDQERESKNRGDNYSVLVDQLESQYLLKVLKPERRLNLATLQQVGLGHVVKIKDCEEIDLTIYVDEMFRYSHWLAASDTDLQLYRATFLQEPVRTIVQVLYGYKECRDNRKKQQAFINTLTDTFLVALQRYGFLASFAKQPETRIILNQLVQKLAEENLLERGYRLKAESDNADLNRLMWVLGAVMAEQLRHNPGLYFDFFIKVGLSREMALRLPFGEGATRITLKDYLKWVGISDGENSMTIARMASGAIRFIAGAGEKTTHIGTVRVMNDDANETKTFTSKDPASLKRKIEQHYRMDVPEWQESLLSVIAGEKKANIYASALPQVFCSKENNAVAVVNGRKVSRNHKVYYCNSIEELESNINSWHRILVNIPAHRLVKRHGEARTTYSIHGLLAFVGEVLQSENINETLRSYSQLRDYPWPAWDRSSGGAEAQFDDSEADEESESTSDIAIPAEVITGLERWKKDFAATTLTNPLPTHIWAKVFTRFYYALQKLDNDLALQDRYLGHIMHRCIILFLNAVLVEEALYRGFSDKVSLKNPATSDKEFYSNLNKFSLVQGCELSVENLEPLYADLPFFSRMATFPLWSFFLSSDGESSDFLYYAKNQYLNMTESKEDFCTYCSNKNFSDFYTLLNSVVLVNEYKSNKITEKIKWENGFFLKAVDGKEKEIKNKLSGLSSEEATKLFIKEFLKPVFIGIPQKKTGNPFKAVTEILKKEGFLSQ